ncbi:AN1-type zinc finger protein 2A isoform X1 [Bos mutus]|uniref:AN1-type zinc finger protein 2A isoform X1 n=1 Tax=Bos mutus TaxID=72004 RepID=UPI0038B5B51F
MEFPDLGKHCSEKTCKQLDFLPLKCDACKQDFCKDHFTYAAHKCPLAFTKDVRVPVCPLCNSPVPVKRGEIPDVVVGAHMDGDCRRPPGQETAKFCVNPFSEHLLAVTVELQAESEPPPVITSMSEEPRAGRGPQQTVRGSLSRPQRGGSPASCTSPSCVLPGPTQVVLWDAGRVAPSLGLQHNSRPHSCEAESPSAAAGSGF